MSTPALLQRIPKEHRFHFDCRDPQRDASGEFLAFVKRLQRRTGEIASGLSLVQPKIYENAVSYVETQVSSNQTRRSNRIRVDSKQCVCEWSHWTAGLRSAFETAKIHQVDENDLMHLTSYLDSSGRILLLNKRLRTTSTGKADDSFIPERNVILDVAWVIRKIYDVVSPSDHEEDLCELIKRNQGRFTESELLGTRTLRLLTQEVSVDPVLQFMQQFGILVRLQSRDTSQDPVFVATERALLPPWAGPISEKCQTEVSSLHPGAAWSGWEYSFSGPLKCEFDVRPILGGLARLFGDNAVFFQDGMQASGRGDDLWRGENELRRGAQWSQKQTVNEEPAWAQTKWVLRVRWVAVDEESMLGQVRGGVVSHGPMCNQVAERIKELLSSLVSSFPGGDRVETRFEEAAFPDVFPEIAPPKSTPAAVENTATIRAGSKQETPPRVLISYSWDSTQHSARVLELANWLRGERIDASIDQFHWGADWNDWMATQMTQVDYVIVIWTERYRERALTPTCSGVRTEWRLIQNRISSAGASNAMFFVCRFDGGEWQNLPLEIQDAFRVELHTEGGCELLKNRILRKGVEQQLLPPIPRNAPPPKFS
jgi:hypothetical protein